MRWIAKPALVLLPALLVLTVLAGWSLAGDAGARNEAWRTAEPPPARPIDEPELDRLIDVLARRAPSRDESVDHRFLGSLLLQRAKLRADVADYRRSFDAFTAAAELAPDEPTALLGLGRAALGIHDFERAAAAAQRLVELDPTDADANALAVDAAIATGDIDTARTHLAQLVDRRPDDPAVTVRRAQVALLTTGRADASGAAAQAIDQAIGQDLTAPEVAFYLSYAGRQAFDRGHYDEATELLERATTLSPTDHGILGELARVRAATGRTTEAIDLLDRANALVPEPDHLLLQADLQDQLGRTGDATANRDRGHALATVDDDHRRAWARALADYHLDGPGDPAEGRRIAERELAARSDAGAWDLAAWAHYRNGDLDRAADAAARALELGPPDARIDYHAAVIANAKGRTDEAVTLLRDALDLHPAFDPIDAPLARSLLDRLE